MTPCRSYVTPVHHAVYDRQEYPKALRPFLPEIRAWTEHNHYNVLHPILRLVTSSVLVHLNLIPRARLLARGMEVPEETFVDMHNFDAPGETWGTSNYTYTLRFVNVAR